MTSDATEGDAARAGADPLAVCSLPEGPLADRLAWVRAEILPHAVSRERLPDGLAWELEAVPGLAAKLDQWIALERECCSGLVFERQAAGPDRLRLVVRGVDPDAAVFAETGVAPATARAAGCCGPDR